MLLFILVLFSCIDFVVYLIFYFTLMADESSASLAHGHVLMGRPGLDLGSSSCPPSPGSYLGGSWWVDFFLPLCLGAVLRLSLASGRRAAGLLGLLSSAVNNSREPAAFRMPLLGKMSPLSCVPHISAVHWLHRCAPLSSCPGGAVQRV